MWSAKARAAAAAARKRNRPAAAKATPLTQRTQTQRNRLLGLADTTPAKGRRQVRTAKRAAYASGKPRTQPHKVIGSQGTPVSGSRPGKPMAAPGVAKPTGQHAFTAYSGSKTTAAQYRAHGAATKVKRQARQMPGGMQNFPTKGVPKGTAAYKRKKGK